MMTIADVNASKIFSHLVAPLLVTAGSIIALKKPAERWGLVDRPSGRKQHDGVVPLIGGIAMIIAFVSTSLMASEGIRGQINLLIGLVLIVALGVIDDFREVSPRRKLFWQCIATLVIVVPNANYLHHLGDLLGLGRLELGWVALPFSVFAIVGMINAANMADGVDGLAGGLTASSVLWMIGLAYLAGRPLITLELMMLFGVTLGFLVFNLRTPLRGRAAVFMGDAGSMMLGTCLGWFAVNLSQVTGPTGVAPPPIVLLWVLGLPVLDTVVLMLRRVRRGRSPFSAGRDHMHHIWLHAGFSAGETTAILVAVNFVLGGIGIAGWRLGVPEWGLLLLYFGVFLLHRSLARHAWIVSTLLRRQRADV